MFREDELQSLRYGTHDQNDLKSFQLRAVTPAVADFNMKVWSDTNSGCETTCLYISNIDKDPHQLWTLSQNVSQVAIEICGKTYRIVRPLLQRSSSDFGGLLKLSGYMRQQVIQELQERLHDWEAHYSWCTKDVVQVWLAYVSTTCYSTRRIERSSFDDQHLFLFQVACLDFGRSIHDSEFEALAIAEIEHKIKFSPLSAYPTTLDEIQLAFGKAPLLDGYLEAGLEGFDEISQGPAYRQFDMSRRDIHVKSWNALWQRTDTNSMDNSTAGSTANINASIGVTKFSPIEGTSLARKKRSAPTVEERPAKRQRKSSLKLEEDISGRSDTPKSVHWGQVHEREEVRVVFTDKEVAFNDESPSEDDPEDDIVESNDTWTGVMKYNTANFADIPTFTFPESKSGKSAKTSSGANSAP